MIKCSTELQPFSVLQGWSVSVCLDMARQVVTGNDSTCALFLKKISYHEDFNHEWKKLL